MRVLTTNDISGNPLHGVPIAVIGYGAQGRSQALSLHDSGLDVTVGVRAGGPSEQRARVDGLPTAAIADAASRCRLIHLLVPDEHHRRVYDEHIRAHLTPGKTLSFSHGFSIVYGQITPPEGVDVILVAPKAPGTESRKAFVEGFGVPGLIAVENDASGRAREIALAFADAIGLTRAGVLECSFADETYEDLFGEQGVLCGGLAELMKAGFETLVDAGYPPEMAYFECVHEMKLIVDLVYEGGLTRMWDVVSNTAEYGGRTIGPKVIGPDVRERMKSVLAAVHDGSFAEQWISECDGGVPTLARLRAEEALHPMEVVGRQVRGLFRRRTAAPVLGAAVGES